MVLAVPVSTSQAWQRPETGYIHQLSPVYLDRADNLTLYLGCISIQIIKLHLQPKLTQWRENSW